MDLEGSGEMGDVSRAERHWSLVGDWIMGTGEGTFKNYSFLSTVSGKAKMPLADVWVSAGRDRFHDRLYT